MNKEEWTKFCATAEQNVAEHNETNIENAPLSAKEEARWLQFYRAHKEEIIENFEDFCNFIDITYS